MSLLLLLVGASTGAAPVTPTVTPAAGGGPGRPLAYIGRTGVLEDDEAAVLAILQAL